MTDIGRDSAAVQGNHLNGIFLIFDNGGTTRMRRMRPRICLAASSWIAEKGSMTDTLRDDTDKHPGQRGQSLGREPVFNLHFSVLVIIVVCTFVHLIRMYALSEEADFALVVRLAFIPARWSGIYSIDPYTFISGITYSLLHGGWGHLAINMIWLAAFGTPLANRMGTMRFLLFWATTAFCSAAFFFLFHAASHVPLVGASGAISAMMAAAARFGFVTTKAGRARKFAGPVLPLTLVLRHRMAITFILLWFAINLVAGFGFLGTGEGNQIAWEAHIGGFLSGFFLIQLLGEKKYPGDKPG